MNLDEVVFGSELRGLSHGDVESGLVAKDRDVEGKGSFSSNLGVKSIQLVVDKVWHISGEYLVNAADNPVDTSVNELLPNPLFDADLKTANGDSGGHLKCPVDIVGGARLNECGHSQVRHFKGLDVATDKPQRLDVGGEVEIDVYSTDGQHEVVCAVHKF